MNGRSARRTSGRRLLAEAAVLGTSLVGAKLSRLMVRRPHRRGGRSSKSFRRGGRGSHKVLPPRSVWRRKRKRRRRRRKIGRGAGLLVSRRRMRPNTKTRWTTTLRKTRLRLSMCSLFFTIYTEELPLKDLCCTVTRLLPRRRRLLRLLQRLPRLLLPPWVLHLPALLSIWTRTSSPCRRRPRV